jgi:hypothetical protein
MLTIKNINKILNIAVDMEWYIKSMHPIVSIIVANVNHEYCYKITIQNKITNTEMKIYLERNSFLNDFYGLYVVKNGNKQEQLLRIEWIKDMDRFLKHIRALTNETNGIVNKQGVVRGCK